MPRDRYDDEDERFDDDERPRRRRSRREDDGDDDRPPPKKGMSTGVIVAIVFGVLVAVALPCVAVMIGLLFPAVTKVREAASRVKASNNMKVVSLGMHSHADKNFKLHGPFVDPPPGAPPILPQDRLSWRVTLLPYMGQNALHQQFRPDEPWNSPANYGPGTQPVKDFIDPLDSATDATTRIRCFYDNGALFDSDPNRRVGLGGVTDGSSNTIAYVDSVDQVLWVRCNDFSFDRNRELPKLGHPKRDVILVAMADGSVRMVSKSISPEVLKSAVTRAGGEPPSALD